MSGEEIRYVVFAPEHRTYAEGSRLKTHIMGGSKILCGEGRLIFGSATPQEVTLEWVNQPDPDEQLCKRCKNIFIKKMNTSITKTT